MDLKKLSIWKKKYKIQFRTRWILWARKHGNSELLAWNIADELNELVEACAILDEEAVLVGLLFGKHGYNFVSLIQWANVGKLVRVVRASRKQLDRVDGLARYWSFGEEIG